MTTKDIKISGEELTEPEAARILGNPNLTHGQAIALLAKSTRTAFDSTGIRRTMEEEELPDDLELAA